MSIMKQFLKTKPECKIKFTLSAEESGNAETVSLVGDFNNWDASATPMKKDKKGNFSATVTIPTGSAQRFRYLVNGETWINDPGADGYEFCTFASVENSLLSV